jgi:hypothetical protein
VAPAVVGYSLLGDSVDLSGVRLLPHLQCWRLCQQGVVCIGGRPP